MPKQNKGPHVAYRKDRACWEVRTYERGKRVRLATGIGSREDAQKRLAEIIVETSRPEKNNTDITIGEIVAYYAKEHLPTIARPDTAINCLERVLPFWGDLKLEDIRKSKGQEYLKYRQKEYQDWQKRYGYKTMRTLSPDTVRREIEQLQAAINYAHKDNIILICPYVWRPSKGKARDRWLTHKEVAKLLRAARSMPRVGDYLPLFILVALYTGARSEAVLSLRWHQVDLQNELIDFKKGQKSKNKGRAIVPIPRRLLRELKKARNRGSDTGYVICRSVPKVKGKKDERIWVPIKSVKNSFETACKIAGIEDATPHTLRHTSASWMVQKGVPLFEVAKWLGHTSTQMVESTYGHMAPAHLKKAKESWG